MKFGILSCLNHPLLPLLIKALLDKRINNFFILLDEKDFSKKDKTIWIERTGSLIDSKFNIYDYEQLEIPFYFVKNHNNDYSKKILSKFKPLFLINSGTPRMIDSSILEIPKIGIINVHPGILPKYRGASSPEWSIYNDDLVGNTSHIMTASDQGPILFKETYIVEESDSYKEIRIKLYLGWVELMSKSS